MSINEIMNNQSNTLQEKDIFKNLLDIDELKENKIKYTAEIEYELVYTLISKFYSIIGDLDYLNLDIMYLVYELANQIQELYLIKKKLYIKYNNEVKTRGITINQVNNIMA